MMDKLYINRRQPGHKYELAIRGLPGGHEVHVYFNQVVTTLGAISALPSHASWSVTELKEGWTERSKNFIVEE